jgi:hypothetical protein
MGLKCIDVRIRWLTLDLTTPDIKVNCDDLKVLGKGDFKQLLKWRVALREEVRVFYPASLSLLTINLG